MSLFWYAIESAAAINGWLFIGLGSIMAMSLPQAQLERRPMRMRKSAQRVPSIAVGVGIYIVGYQWVATPERSGDRFFCSLFNSTVVGGYDGACDLVVFS